MKTILAHGSRTLVMNLVQIGCGFFASLVMTRTLGPEGRGYYALVALIAATVAMLCNPSIYASANYFLSTNKWTPSQAVGTILLGGGLFGAVAAAVSIAVAWVIGAAGTGKDGQIILPILVGVLTFTTVLTSSANGLFYGARRVSAITNWKIVFGILQVLSCLAAAYFHGGVLAFVAVFASMSVLDMVVVFGMFMLRSCDKPVTSIKLLREMLVYGVPVYSSRVLQFLGQRLDSYLVYLVVGTVSLGFYSISVTLAELVLIMPSAISLIMMPNIGRLDDRGAAIIVASVSRLLFTTVVCISIVMACLMPLAIPLLYGSVFSPAVLPFSLLLPGTIALSLFSIVEPFFQSRGKPGIPLRITATGMAVNLGACLPLTWLYGMEGAAIGSTLAYVTQLAVLAIAFRRMTGIPIRELLGVDMVIAEGTRWLGNRLQARSKGHSLVLVDVQSNERSAPRNVVVVEVEDKGAD